MRWRGRRASVNIEDRRGMGGGGGGGMGIPLKLGGGLGGIVIILILICLGVDPRALLNPGGGVAIPQPAPQGQAGPDGEFVGAPAEEELKEFVAVVLADTEQVWGQILPQQMQVDYREPTLVLFRDSVNSACGRAGASSGPFYCPLDEKVYIDLSFYEELRQRFGADGDFAQAYVISHEVGHHVQNILGITDKVHAMQGRVSEAEYNDASVRLELQADFLAGVWAHHDQKLNKILESGDIEEAMNAAQAIGDDTIQRRTQGYIVPESFTHGSSAQRKRWFLKGFESGDIEQGDTFSAQSL